jgi:AcrR family transcriptional regulator
MELFLARGFDNVTTAEVARAADVSPATLFNYFATKEDLFFGQVEELEQILVHVVQSCEPGQSTLRALQEHVLYDLTAGRVDSDPQAIAPFHHQVQQSARLQSREAEILNRREAVLAEALIAALDCSADPLPARVAAALFVTAEHLVTAELRARLAAGAPAVETLRDIDGYIDEIFAILRQGLGELPARQIAAAR